jgi:hypothetical protein
VSGPRIRTLKPEFFADEKVNAISISARYVAIGLNSGPAHFFASVELIALRKEAM